MSRYDTIIIGAGHNGLVCASYLAKAGQNVAVIEAAEAPGGLARPYEFHDGFRVPVAHDAGHFSQKVIDDLQLDQHALGDTSLPSPLVGLAESGEHVIVNDGVTGASDSDAARWHDYRQLLQSCAGALEPFWGKTMPRIGVGGLREMLTFAHVGWNLRRLGKKDMHEFMRIASLPARDLMDEYFDNELLKATLSWDGLTGGRMAPRSPNSAVLVMLYRLAGVRVNAARVVSALVSGAEANGVDIRCGESVARIQIDASEAGLTANGVKLANGETLEADRVISSADPQKTFLSLVGVENLNIGFTNRIRRLRCRGYVAKLHLALDGLPDFAGLDRPEGRLLTAPSMDAIEFAFDDAKYGDCSAEPALEITVPTLNEPSLAPDGKHVLSAHVMYVPHELKGCWTEAARDEIRERAIDRLAAFAPGIREQILHSELLTPADLERDFNVTGGHWHHTEIAMDQMLMMRPTYEAAQYSTPIPGLWLCGAGCHPGGDVTGLAGHNAAQEVLR